MSAELNKLDGRASRRALRLELADQAPERDLLAAHRLGDASAFRDLTKAFSDRLLQFFYRQSANRDVAEDLTQEVFLKLLRTSSQYESRGALSQYVFQIAVNTWIDYYRKERGTGPLYSLDSPLLPHSENPLRDDIADRQGASPSSDAEKREEHVRLMKAIQRLTPPHRLTIELALQHFSYAEIGNMLNIPEGTVKSRVHNSVRALRELLQPAAAITRKRA